MTAYNPKDVIGDFAKRTRKNLDVIDALASTHLGQIPDPKVFEATQFVNSLLGLLVFPQQGWFNHLPKTSLADLEAAGWPKINFSVNTINCRKLNDLARLLRNAVGHFNLKFVVDHNNDISGLVLWNHQDGDRKKPINLKVEFNLVDLRRFVNKFIDELIAIQKSKI